MHAILRAACVCSAVAAALVAGAPADAASDHICRPSTTVPAVAAAAHVSSAHVSIAPSMGGNGMPQCTFAAHGHAARLSVTVNVDNGPQAGWRLMRTVTEASQIFGVPPPDWRPPIGLNGLGPYASWFPELNALMAANNADLLTVTVDWRAPRPAMIALARRIIVPFLRR